MPDEKTHSGTLVQAADEDAVFHWGRNVDVDWRMVIYITLRDQASSVKRDPDHKADMMARILAVITARPGRHVGLGYSLPRRDFDGDPIRAVPGFTCLQRTSRRRARGQYRAGRWGKCGGRDRMVAELGEELGRRTGDLGSALRGEGQETLHAHVILTCSSTIYAWPKLAMQKPANYTFEPPKPP